MSTQTGVFQTISSPKVGLILLGCALVAQSPHTQSFLHHMSSPNAATEGYTANYFISWAGALSMDASVLWLVANKSTNASALFTLLSCIINLFYYRQHNNNIFDPETLLASVSLPLIIMLFSHKVSEHSDSASEHTENSGPSLIERFKKFLAKKFTKQSYVVVDETEDTPIPDTNTEVDVPQTNFLPVPVAHKDGRLSEDELKILALIQSGEKRKMKIIDGAGVSYPKGVKYLEQLLGFGYIVVQDKEYYVKSK